MSVLRNLLILATPFFVTACDAADTNSPETKVNQAEVAAVKQDAVEVLDIESSTGEFDEATLRARFESMGVNVVSIAPATIDGLYEVDTTGGMVFSNAQGDQFIAGTLYALDDNGQYVDVLAERQAPKNAEKIEQYASDMIVYPAENEKYVITVFTDTTCTYCVRLHSQMQGYNDLGITVRYLAYPRQGPTGEVAQEMARIWCSVDPEKSMTQAKLNHSFNEDVDNLEQCGQKIMEQYALGRDLGISGTPAVFLPNGKLLAGYMPPAGLFKRIQQEMTQ
ncbi:thioredoxin fold domain-containing protein [Vibrio algarum]|uniref:Thiol:disulfide interchange protein n=1 Tax=Vibrio algarum TaxID=3020714 RepID=A0ABT4YTE2_9VIBR|nr:thioredoxin fold domain-containing protein [Vibrio sp. KJ40-1]MDB1124827.1 thioredoxin fold domain-containing protein [Vibrio sp. KJ40-1]